MTDKQKVTIVSLDRSSEIRITIDGAEVDNYPSLNVIVEVKDSAFSGSVITWLAMDDFNRFLAQLKQCERTRQGQAVLTSMSPDEFELQLQNLDRSGHFVALYKLTRLHYTTTGIIRQSLSGGFALDAEFFIKLLSDFEELVVPIPSSSMNKS